MVAAAAAGSTVVAVVDTKLPLLVSYDAGATWRESGRGLPAGRAVASAEDAPAVVVVLALFSLAAQERLKRRAQHQPESRQPNAVHQ